MMQLTPPEFFKVQRRDPNLIGVPRFFTMIDGEPEWYPQTTQGTFRILGPCEPNLGAWWAT
jgi:hypothetical protein